MIDIEKLKRLTAKIEGELEFKKLTKENIGSLKCDNGVYLIKDDTEGRIVRVGINEKDGGLKNRMLKHLQSKECSPFRKRLGAALIQSNQAVEIELWQWYIKKSEVKTLMSEEEFRECENKIRILEAYVPDTGMWLTEDAFTKNVINDNDYAILLRLIRGE